jgi:hypothetical protein
MGNSISDRMVERLKNENLELVDRINVSRKDNLDLKDQMAVLEKQVTKMADEANAKA